MHDTLLLVAQTSADMIAINSALAACAINPQPLRSSETSKRGVVNQSYGLRGALGAGVVSHVCWLRLGQPGLRAHPSIARQHRGGRASLPSR